MKALVTRPAEDAAPLARALAERGIEAVLAPMLTIRPASDAATRISDALIGAQAVLVTSANGIRVFASASARRELPVFAVGDASAAAARLAECRSVTSAGGDVADLAALVAARLSPQQGALVHIAGSEVAGDLAGMLGKAGFAVRRVVVYEARPAAALSPEAAAVIARGEPALALFFSPRTAATFVRLAAAAGMGPSCRALTALALSPAVASALDALPWRHIAVARAPTQQALLEAIDRERGEHKRSMGAE
ncbi:MAG TPA: uroporphyrinogen-III synthase [Stellaceae bacterium]|nr:uroporphyrinogen-III synthase [Stellaceae bacterium]